jgi:hypothetical protein
MEKQRGMMFAFRKTATSVIQPDRQTDSNFKVSTLDIKLKVTNIRKGLKPIKPTLNTEAYIGVPFISYALQIPSCSSG